MVGRWFRSSLDDLGKKFENLNQFTGSFRGGQITWFGIYAIPRCGGRRLGLAHWIKHLSLDVRNLDSPVTSMVNGKTLSPGSLTYLT